MPAINDELRSSTDALLAAERRKENLELGWPDDPVAAADAETLADTPEIGRDAWIRAQVNASRRGDTSNTSAARVGDAGDSTAADDAAGDDEPIGRDAWIKRQSRCRREVHDDRRRCAK